jgi:Cu(I)-responsive transcriptional regulator
MNIGDLARAADTKAETIRYYERIGLLPPPPRTAGNYRDYSAADVSRLAFTRRGRDLGFSIEQIRALLALAEHKEQSCEAVGAIAHEHLAEVKRKLAELSALRRALESLIGQCRHGTVAECRILEALVPDALNRKRAQRTMTHAFRFPLSQQRLRPVVRLPGSDGALRDGSALSKKTNFGNLFHKNRVPSGDSWLRPIGQRAHA